MLAKLQKRLYVTLLISLTPKESGVKGVVAAVVIFLTASRKTEKYQSHNWNKFEYLIYHFQ